MEVSAYIPCFNNAATIEKTIASIRNQTISVSEIIVIDDASTDNSASIAKQCDAHVIELKENRGRGYARALAMRETRNEIVLCVDGNKIVCANFLEAAEPWLAKPEYAGIRAHIVEEDPESVFDRWRARHMFREDKIFTVTPDSPLITSAAVLRKSVVMEVGNYREDMAHSEDRELGERLEKAGYHIGFDPNLWVKYVGNESLGKILDRYWRWSHIGNKPMSFIEYLRCIPFAATKMCSKDLQCGDVAGAAISFITPHYQYGRTLLEQFKASKS